MKLRRPAGLTRMLAKLPLLCYRLGLGWLLGTRFVQIAHRGRKSGLIRWTVAEVLRYTAYSQEIIVVSGWSGKTDWYRNIQQEPALEIQIGRTAYRPVQQLLSPEETATEVLNAFKKHPQEARIIGPLLGIDITAAEPLLREQIATVLRGVRFCPMPNA
jgi:deazaflavin-dependent oxidoreductase (nitroreductase family)